MKRYIIGFIGIVLHFQVLAGEIKYPVSQIPEALLEDVEAVVRLDESIFTVHSKEKTTNKIKWVCTILSSKADKYAKFVQWYDDLSKITSLKGFLYDKNGKLIKKLKSGDIIDQSYISGISLFEDNRVKIAKLTHASYPYTVEFECEVQFDHSFFYPSWTPLSYEKTAVEKSSIKVDVPTDLPLRFQEINVSPAKITEEGERKVYSWEEKNLIMTKGQAFTNKKIATSKVLLAPSKFGIDGVEGDMTTWKNYGKFIDQLSEGTIDLSPSAINKVKDLIKDVPTKKAQIAKVYEYLQEKTRYVSIQVGIGGWKPFPASMVDEKGYGDCKALSNYTKAMLEAVGINAFYTLVSAGDEPRPILKDFPVNNFNHAILVVPLEKDTVWLECTSQTQAMGYMGDFTGNRDVLVVTPEGGEIWRTPAYKKDVNYTKRNVKVSLDEKGNAKINSNTIFSTLQEGSRAFLVNNSKEEQKKWLYEQIELSDFTINNFSMKRHKSEFPYIEEKLEIDDPSFARVSGKRIFIEPNIFSKWDYIPRKVEERKNDVYLDNSYDFIDTDTIEFELPENYHVEYKPDPVSLENQFGKYSMTIEVEHNKVKYIRKWEMNPGTYPKDSYEELRNFYKEITKLDKTKIVMVNNT